MAEIFSEISIFAQQKGHQEVFLKLSLKYFKLENIKKSVQKMTGNTLAYVIAVKGTVNSSYEERKTLKEVVCEDLKRKGKGHGWLW